MAPATAQEKEPKPGESPRVGHTIRVTLPIAGQTVERVQQFVKRAVENAQADKQRLVLIFDFEVLPDQAEYGRGSDFGAALSLAEFLTGEDLNDVHTVAYIPQTIKGHAVLVALACDEVIMAKDAKLGQAGADDRAITETRRANYKEIANRRKTIPAEVALWLLDPKQEVLVVETAVSREFVTPAELAALEKRQAIKPKKRRLFDPDNPGDSVVQEAGLLSGEEAR